MSVPTIGAPRNRAGGVGKVTGFAQYTCDRALDGMLHAVVVPSTIGVGRIVAIDASAARKAEGVVLVMTHENAPRVNPDKGSAMDAKLFLLQNGVVEFDRQTVAVVVANAFEQAVHGADLVRVRYEASTPQMNLDSAPVSPAQIFGQPGTHTGGAGASALGEVAMCGSAAAVANAVYHATGVRVRELPITVEALLT